MWKILQVSKIYEDLFGVYIFFVHKTPFLKALFGNTLQNTILKKDFILRSKNYKKNDEKKCIEL